jgi:glyoxylase-like metal-dependent hydrolase (beta-lactamase superfamily II)
MTLGDMEITAIHDGTTRLGAELLKDIKADDVRTLLDRMFVDSAGGVQTSINAFLIHTGKNLVLIDTGAAGKFGPSTGGMLENIKAAGYSPEQIDTVLVTHLHPDHACGLLTTDGKAAFPNAQVWVGKTEADYWLSESVAAQAPKDAQGAFKLARDSVAPYGAAKRLHRFNIGDSLVDNITAVAAPGHTPGHTAYLVTAGPKQSLLVWGDIVHNHSVQFARPDVAIEFDTDAKQAVVTRKKIFAEAAQNRLWVAGAHLPFPGLGHVRTEGNGSYAWVPIEFGPIK